MTPNRDEAEVLEADLAILEADPYACVDERVGADEFPRDNAYDDVAEGKYYWWEEGRNSTNDAPVVSESITEYSWCDGTAVVSIYITLDGLDAVADQALLLEFGDRRISLTILGIGLPPKLRRFAASCLYQSISDVKLQRKQGKNTVVLKLAKLEDIAWPSLLGNADVESCFPGGGRCDAS
eukprot:TRINITY_DN46446_c0_g1_i1.p1 TRINITY_DN46446_c0_g1~~TRINITY_DN46446_c0_g1_i1.p1  ORF type:complete len:181 (-),score=31.43 TRINITY_DN46446_c0_g1_i1:317-859(-)